MEWYPYGLFLIGALASFAAFGAGLGAFITTKGLTALADRLAKRMIENMEKYGDDRFEDGFEAAMTYKEQLECLPTNGAEKAALNK
jgi:hypothetical protein